MDKCPNCGAIINSSDKRCSKCGKKLNNNSKFIIIGVIALIAVIAIGAFFAMNQSQPDNTNVVNDTGSQQDTASVENASNDSQQTGSDSTESSSDDSGTVYWASSKTDKFHLPTCEWAQKISSWNKIVYDSRQEALNSGRQPCEVCNP